MIDATQLVVMRRQEITSRELEDLRNTKGQTKAFVMCGGLIVGVVSYMVRHYGTRRTYEYIQQLADNIAAEEINI